MQNKYVVFEVSCELFGIEIQAVERIIDMQPIFSVPQMPPFVEGITNLRGNVLPVIDLRKRFGLHSPNSPDPAPKKDTFSHKTRIIVVDVEGLAIGMIVDAVLEVMSLEKESIEPLSPIISNTDQSFIKGIAQIDNRLIGILALSEVILMDQQAGLALE